MQIFVNDLPYDMPEGATVASLLDELELTGKPVAVEVNLELVPRSKQAAHVLSAHDRLEVVTLVGGG